MEEKRCPNCNNPMKENEIFCTFCGYKITKEKKKHTGCLIAIIVVLCVLLTIFICFVSCVNNISEKANSEVSSESSKSKITVSKEESSSSTVQKPEIKKGYEVKNTKNMKLGEIGEHEGLNIALAYVKEMTYLPTMVYDYKGEVTNGNVALIPIFELYNYSDEPIYFDRSDITAYVDGVTVSGVDCIYKITVDGIKQFDKYKIDPNTKAYCIIDFETPKDFEELKIYCGSENIWTLSRNEVSTEKFNGETLYKEVKEIKKDTIIGDGFSIHSYNGKEEREIKFDEFKVIKYKNYVETKTYAIFKLSITNTSDKELDYYFVGYDMRAYKDNYLIGEADYLFDEKIDGYVNVFDIDSIQPGMTAKVYVAIECEDKSGHFKLAYDEGYIVENLVGYIETEYVK